MCKNSKNWEIWQKIMKKKMKKFSISHLKSMQLYFTHLLVPKNDEPRPWGGPQGCANCAKMAKIGEMGINGQKIMKKNEKVFDILPEINATILHTPARTQK